MKPVGIKRREPKAPPVYNPGRPPLPMIRVGDLVRLAIDPKQPNPLIGIDAEGKLKAAVIGKPSAWWAVLSRHVGDDGRRLNVAEFFTLYDAFAYLRKSEYLKANYVVVSTSESDLRPWPDVPFWQVTERGCEYGPIKPA